MEYNIDLVRYRCLILLKVLKNNGFETGVKLKDFKEQYIASCKNAHVGAYEQACESFNQIKTGDYVLMKLLDAKFYFGKVKWL